MVIVVLIIQSVIILLMTLYIWRNRDSYIIEEIKRMEQAERAKLLGYIMSYCKKCDGTTCQIRETLDI